MCVIQNESRRFNNGQLKFSATTAKGFTTHFHISIVLSENLRNKSFQSEFNMNLGTLRGLSYLVVSLWLHGHETINTINNAIILLILLKYLNTIPANERI